LLDLVVHGHVGKDVVEEDVSHGAIKERSMSVHFLSAFDLSRRPPAHDPEPG
jgi:hypothetical protein